MMNCESIHHSALSPQHSAFSMRNSEWGMMNDELRKYPLLSIESSVFSLQRSPFSLHSLPFRVHYSALSAPLVFPYGANCAENKNRKRSTKLTPATKVRTMRAPGILFTSGIKSEEAT
jgi:hypothetical protein